MRERMSTILHLIIMEFNHYLLPSANIVSWQAEPATEIEAKYKGQMSLISGKPDYVLWY